MYDYGFVLESIKVTTLSSSKKWANNMSSFLRCTNGQYTYEKLLILLIVSRQGKAQTP